MVSAEILDEGPGTYRLNSTQLKLHKHKFENIAKHYQFGHKHFKVVEKYLLYFLPMTPHSLRTLKVHVIFSQDDPPLPEDDKDNFKSICDIFSGRSPATWGR